MLVASVRYAIKSEFAKVRFDFYIFYFMNTIF
jgi:hypothetical protein